MWTKTGGLTTPAPTAGRGGSFPTVVGPANCNQKTGFPGVTAFRPAILWRCPRGDKTVPSPSSSRPRFSEKKKRSGWALAPATPGWRGGTPVGMTNEPLLIIVASGTLQGSRGMRRARGAEGVSGGRPESAPVRRRSRAAPVRRRSRRRGLAPAIRGRAVAPSSPGRSFRTVAGR